MNESSTHQKTIRVRRWSGTWNNYTEDGVQEFIKKHENFIRFFVGGREVGENGTHHLQIYMETYKQTLLGTLKTWCSAIHWEPSKKPRLANVRYCTKQDTNPIYAGKESDTNTPKSYSTTVTELATQDAKNFTRVLPAIQHIEGTELWQTWLSSFSVGKVNRPDVIYITGPTGSGKTWKAFEIAMENFTAEDISIVECSNGFFNALNIRAKCWIFPEFRPACLEASIFLQITDIYPFIANIKGAHAVVRPEMVIIASIKQVQDIYKEEINRQFQRRITRTIDMGINPAARWDRRQEQEVVVPEMFTHPAHPPQSWIPEWNSEEDYCDPEILLNNDL